MKLLFLGDVDAKPGREAVRRDLPTWRKEHHVDVVVANAENSAGGFGATPNTLDELLAAGVDAFTMGDHTFDRPFEPLAEYPIVRPANFKQDVGSGVGHRVIGTPAGKLLLINLIGFAFMRADRQGSNYFDFIDQILREYEGEDIAGSFIDFHAEPTSEKNAFAYHVDGRVSGIVGTHTHVPTADSRILPKGTAYQTDAGFCGAFESVIGVTPEASKAFLLKEMGLPVEKGSKSGAYNPPYACDAVLIDIVDRHSAKSVRRITSRPQVAN